MARHDRKNPDGPNFGLGSRNMIRAGLHALREGMQSYSSIKTMHDRWRIFGEYARSELNVHSMKQIEVHHLQMYGAHLREKLERGQIRPGTAQNYLSAANRVLEIARGDRTVRLDPVRGAGLPQRSGICRESRAVSLDTHERAREAVPERIRVLMDVQRSLGLRFEESAKLNAKAALNQAEKTGSVSILDGTKGGRARIVPITRPEQIAALQAAAVIQGNHRSMIPSYQQYAAFRAEAYRHIGATETTYHGQRHAYAQSRYETLVGTACPVAAGVAHKAQHAHISSELNISIQAAKELDRHARQQIAEELGHGRLEITNSYLG